MQAKIDYHSFIGMQQDITLSKHPNNMLKDAFNIRITQREDETLLAITNERGPEDINVNVPGDYLGHCLMNEYLVVFTTEYDWHSSPSKTDYITRITLKPVVASYSGGTMTVYPTYTLFKGNLNFITNIEAIASYENENIQKVYWTDGYNQPRVINILSETVDRYREQNVDTSVYLGYDFVMTLKLEETVTVEKMLGASGMFPAGVLQYAFTYYMKHGQETAVFYTTPLLYTSYKERGGSPEDTVENAFRIKVDNVDVDFDYLRIYSIIRTSLNGTPMCRRVQDIELKNLEAVGDQYNVSFIDTGREGDTIDPTELLYKGGEVVSASTIEQKDGTLFFGDIRLTRNSLKNCYPDIPVVSSDSDNEEESESNTREPFHWIWDSDPISIGGTNAGTSTGNSGNNNQPSGGSNGHQIQNTGDVVEIITDSNNNDSDEDIPVAGESLYDYIKRVTEISESTRTFVSPKVFEGSYDYSNQLTSYDTANYNHGIKNNVPCGGFKRGDYYRLGVQFQHKSGAWSEPVWICDKQVVNNSPSLTGISVTVPAFEGSMPNIAARSLISLGYKRARALVVFPEMQDRVVLCQGVANPTMLHSAVNNIGDQDTVELQSSWFFRFKHNGASQANGFVSPTYTGDLNYTANDVNPNIIRNVEIQGRFDDKHKYSVAWDVSTLHSPDIAFNDDYLLLDFSNCGIQKVSSVIAEKTFSNIEIQTSSPTIKDLGSGFLHKSGVQDYSYGINTGLFYEDYLVDDVSGENTYTFANMDYPAWFVVYPWQRNSALNNDVNRPNGKGTTTSELKKKIISNLRYATTSSYSTPSAITTSLKPQVFNSEQSEILKLEHYEYVEEGQQSRDIPRFYKGNVDTLLSPDSREGSYFAYGDGTEEDFHDNNDHVDTTFVSDIRYRTFSGRETVGGKDYAASVYWYDNNQWNKIETEKFGDKDESIGAQKGNVRMKYKSTPHLVFDGSEINISGYGNWALPVLEVTQNPVNKFGGDSEDALKANTWLPCGEPVLLKSDEDTEFQYSYGDTYYQRWDCLKTYAYAQEDINQIVEIGSFMLETHINIDGRYDRNRGQVNNLYMSPLNFNLLNSVYSQKDNFFQYKILDSSYYKNSEFPNQITWTKEKRAGADTDLWTNITLASTLDMDGSKGKVQSLNAWGDRLYCFQDKGISVILFNSRVQIPVSDGVPIEITNGYKVDGYKFISDGIGCTNKWTIKETPYGIYFIDSVKSNLCRLSEGIDNLSERLNTKRWFNEHTVNKVLYDDVHNDVYSVSDSESLCYSEALNNFVSRMSYNNLPLIESHQGNVFTLHGNKMWKMFFGEYNNFFSEYKPWWIKFVSNGASESLMTLDKIFTNIDYRMDFFNDGVYEPTQTFDFLNVTNEYQRTNDADVESAESSNLEQYLNKGISAKVPFTKGNPQKKFKQWRIQIPRSLKYDNDSEEWKRTNDRIRNPWCEITLGKLDSHDFKAVLQDLVVQYYI